MLKRLIKIKPLLALQIGIYHLLGQEALLHISSFPSSGEEGVPNTLLTHAPKCILTLTLFMIHT